MATSYFASPEDPVTSPASSPGPASATRAEHCAPCPGADRSWFSRVFSWRYGLCYLALVGFFWSTLTTFAQPQPSFSPSLREARELPPASLNDRFGALDPSKPSGITPAEIIERFAAKESQFKIALENYTYRRSVKFDTLDDKGKVDGEFFQVDDIVFSSLGHKREMVVYAPNSTLTRVAMSPADFDDIENRLPFTLTTEDIALYRVTYVGKQPVDRIPMYVFDVAPKQIEKGQRYFLGRIWVDAQDLQIVVTKGKNVPDNTRRNNDDSDEDLSVPFTTYRQQIDGKYWFPVYTVADGVLHFRNCKKCLPEDDHVREIVKYADYKRFGTDIRIIYDGLASDESAEPAPSASIGPSSLNSENPLRKLESATPLDFSAAPKE